jgi:hypothetical protein
MASSRASQFGSCFLERPWRGCMNASRQARLCLGLSSKLGCQFGTEGQLGRSSAVHPSTRGIPNLDRAMKQMTTRSQSKLGSIWAGFLSVTPWAPELPTCRAVRFHSSSRVMVSPSFRETSTRLLRCHSRLRELLLCQTDSSTTRRR